jgi:hypothetical protein
VKDAIAVMKSGFSPDKAQVEQATADIRWLRSSGIQNPTDAVQAAELARDFDVAAAIQGQVHTFRRMTETQRAGELGIEAVVARAAARRVLAGDTAKVEIAGAPEQRDAALFGLDSSRLDSDRHDRGRTRVATRQ